jgi:hypothetical protein
MMADMQCPYCEADQKVCHDDWHGYSEGVKHEHMCRACGKYFVFETFISFDYEPSKADCLNGSDHDLKMSRTWPREAARMRCQHCEYERKPTPEEFATTQEPSHE